MNKHKSVNDIILPDDPKISLKSTEQRILTILPLNSETVLPSIDN